MMGSSTTQHLLTTLDCLLACCAQPIQNYQWQPMMQQADKHAANLGMMDDLGGFDI